MKKIYGIVYCSTNSKTGFKYIGATRLSLGVRKSAHLYEEKNFISNTPLAKALREDGKENFEWSVLEKCFSDDELRKKETLYIKKFKSSNPEHGYNVDEGGRKSHHTFQADDPGTKTTIILNSAARKKILDIKKKSGLSFSAIVDRMILGLPIIGYEKEGDRRD